MLYLPDETYSLVERAVPIACVDFVPHRVSAASEHVGLILRDSPFGRVWCHLGGRIGRGETIRDALDRHARETLNVTLLLDEDPQPKHVYQWFPSDDRPASAERIAHGDDPRKHAIGLSYLVEMEGVPQARNEALDFAWFDLASLPTPLWPGCEALIERLTA